MQNWQISKYIKLLIVPILFPIPVPLYNSIMKLENATNCGCMVLTLNWCDVDDVYTKLNLRWVTQVWILCGTGRKGKEHYLFCLFYFIIIVIICKRVLPVCHTFPTCVTCLFIELSLAMAFIIIISVSGAKRAIVRFSMKIL